MELRAQPVSRIDVDRGLAGDEHVDTRLRADVVRLVTDQRDEAFVSSDDGPLFGVTETIVMSPVLFCTGSDTAATLSHASCPSDAVSATRRWYFGSGAWTTTR